MNAVPYHTIYLDEGRQSAAGHLGHLRADGPRCS